MRNLKTPYKTIAVFAVLAMLCAITGCSTNTDRNRLNQAESLLKNAPFEALEALNMMDESSITDSSAMARCALLYSEALLKNKITPDNDNKADFALHYYSTHGPEEMARRAAAVKEAIDLSIGSDECISMQELYMEKMREYTAEKKRLDTRTGIVVSIVMGLTMLLFVAYQYTREQKHKAENDLVLTIAASLKDAFKASRQTMERYSKESLDELAEKMYSINDLCTEYYDNGNTDSEKLEIVKRIRHLLKDLKGNRQTLAIFENALNESQDDVLLHLKETLHGLSADEYGIFVYMANGFSMQAVSVLTGDSLEEVYKRREILRKRVAAAPEGDAKRILQNAFM